MSRTQNARRNILFGVILRIYKIIIPFIIRTVMIYSLGVEYLGLNSLFVSILQMLNLAELGIGSAMVYSMYKPIAEKKDELVCALMALYRKAYRIIGIVVAISGMVILPFIKYLIKSEVPQDINIYILFMLYLGSTVCSYWLFAYRSSLLTAYQRSDIISKVTIGVNSVQYIFQILALIIFYNYYLFIIIELLGQIVINLAVAYFSKRMYPKYSPSGRVEGNELYEIKKRVGALVISRIGGTILTSADSIVISTFLGLVLLAKYQNYFLLITSITSILEIIFTSITASIGNSLVLESKEKNYNDFRKIAFIFSFVIAICSACFISMYQPFMRLWLGDTMLLSYEMVCLFVAYFIVFEITRMLNLYKNAAGVWYEDRFRPLVSAIVNIILNIILVNIVGLPGVLISTIIALGVIEIPWLIINIFSTIFSIDLRKMFTVELIKYVICITLTCVIVSTINMVNTLEIIKLLTGAACSIVISICVFVLIYRKTRVYIDSKKLLLSMLIRNGYKKM